MKRAAGHQKVNEPLQLIKVGKNLNPGRKLQMQADIVGYHVEALTMAFFLGIFVLVAYWELRRD